MKKLITSLIVILTMATIATAADKPTAKEMMHMLKVSGAVDVINQVTEQVVANTTLTIKEKDPSLPHEAYVIINDEMRAGMKHWTREILVKQMDYYSNHLTRSEVLELTKMYQSPAYKKMIKVGQIYITQELQPLLQRETPLVTKQILEQIGERLKKEGYIKKTEGGA